MERIQQFSYLFVACFLWSGTIHSSSWWPSESIKTLRFAIAHHFPDGWSNNLWDEACQTCHAWTNYGLRWVPVSDLTAEEKRRYGIPTTENPGSSFRDLLNRAPWRSIGNGLMISTVTFTMINLLYHLYQKNKNFGKAPNKSKPDAVAKLKQELDLVKNKSKV